MDLMTGVVAIGNHSFRIFTKNAAQEAFFPGFKSVDCCLYSEFNVFE